MNYMHYQIIAIFGLVPQIVMNKGLWFSGERGEGEFISYSKRSGSWKIKEKGFYKNDKKQGEWIFNSSKGKLKVHGFFKNGERHGEYKIWGQNGELEHHAIYNNDEKIKDFLE